MPTLNHISIDSGSSTVSKENGLVRMLGLHARLLQFKSIAFVLRFNFVSVLRVFFFKLLMLQSEKKNLFHKCSFFAFAVATEGKQTLRNRDFSCNTLTG